MSFLGEDLLRVFPVGVLPKSCYVSLNTNTYYHKCRKLQLFLFFFQFRPRYLLYVNIELIRQKQRELCRPRRIVVVMDRSFMDEFSDDLARHVEIAMLENELKYIQHELIKKKKALK